MLDVSLSSLHSLPSPSILPPHKSSVASNSTHSFHCSHPASFDKRFTMARVTSLSVLSLALLLANALALPPLWPHGYGQDPESTSISFSSDGLYPTGSTATTDTSIGSATDIYQPPSVPSTSSEIEVSATVDPVASSSSYSTTLDSATTRLIPTGTSVTITAAAPSGSGTGFPLPAYLANKREVRDAKQIHRRHFEGPRRRDLNPYYPVESRNSVPDSNESPGPAFPTATAPTGGSGPGTVTRPTGDATLPTGSATLPSGSPSLPTDSVTLPNSSTSLPTGSPSFPTGSVTLPTESVTMPTNTSPTSSSLVVSPTAPSSSDGFSSTESSSTSTSRYPSTSIYPYPTYIGY